MFNKNRLEEICFELNTKLKTDFNNDEIHEKLEELKEIVSFDFKDLFYNKQYLSLIKKLIVKKGFSEELNVLFFSKLGENKIKEKNKMELIKLGSENYKKNVLFYFMKKNKDDLYTLIEYENQNSTKIINEHYIDILCKVLKLKSRKENLSEKIENFMSHIFLTKNKSVKSIKLYLLKKIVNFKLNEEQKNILLTVILSSDDNDYLDIYLKLSRLNEYYLVESIINEISNVSRERFIIMLKNYKNKENIKMITIEKIINYLSLKGIVNLEKRINDRISNSVKNRVEDVEEEILKITQKVKLDKELKNF